MGENMTTQTELIRTAYSREEIIQEAKRFMVETYGPVSQVGDKDKWHEKLGLLVSFLHDKFPIDGGQR